jgi:hypothetical protein
MGAVARLQGVRVISFAQIAGLTGDRLGRSDVPCPLCSPIDNGKKRVLRIWRDDPNFVGFVRARCGEKGWARVGASTERPSEERLAEIRADAQARAVAERADGLARSRALWGRRQSVVQGTAAETYLREACGYREPIPSTLGFLPPSEGYPPALIAAFGLATEPELGRLAFNDADLRGVHLIRLARDGRDRLRSDDAKVMIGRGSLGSPICIAAPNDLLGLLLCQGVETGLSAHEATGPGVWASGGASRLPALAAVVPAWMDSVTVLADVDRDGLAKARELRDALLERGFNVETRSVS